MKFKQLHFAKAQNCVLNSYEEANAGFITARIWERKDKEGNLKAFQVVLDSDADQLDGATVVVSEFESIEDAQEHARSVAQEMFENYIKNNFLSEWGRYE